MAKTPTSKTKAVENTDDAAQLTPEELAAKAAQDAADAEAQAKAEAEAQAKLDAELDAAASQAALEFPRDMRVVNHTARVWVVRKHIPASSADTVITVRDVEDLHTLRQNCRAVLALSDHWKPVEGEPDALRIVEVDEQI